MLEVVHQQVLGELDWKGSMRTVKETALVPCHNCTYSGHYGIQNRLEDSQSTHHVVMLHDTPHVALEH